MLHHVTLKSVLVPAYNGINKCQRSCSESPKTPKTKTGECECVRVDMAAKTPTPAGALRALSGSGDGSDWDDLDDATDQTNPPPAPASATRGPLKPEPSSHKQGATDSNDDDDFDFGDDDFGDDGANSGGGMVMKLPNQLQLGSGGPNRNAILIGELGSPIESSDSSMRDSGIPKAVTNQNILSSLYSTKNDLCPLLSVLLRSLLRSRVALPVLA